MQQDAYLFRAANLFNSVVKGSIELYCPETQKSVSDDNLVDKHHLVKSLFASKSRDQKAKKVHLRRFLF